MPLPMVHLLLAEKIGELAGIEPDAYFLLGSLAPDAIHMRAGSNRKDKHKTHFFSGKKWDDQEVQQHFETVIAKIDESKEKEPEVRSFLTGYYIHTILDMFWVVGVFNVLANTLHAGGISFEDIRTKYYAETNSCDIYLYQTQQWAGTVRNKISQVVPMEMEGLLTAQEIGRWRDVVLQKMERYEIASPQEVFYITNANIQSFTDDLAKKIYKLL